MSPGATYTSGAHPDLHQTLACMGGGSGGGGSAEMKSPNEFLQHNTVFVWMRDGVGMIAVITHTHTHTHTHTLDNYREPPLAFTLKAQ